MKNGTITGTVTTPIVLGSGNYGAQLTIAATGVVAPTGNYDAISAPAGLVGVRIDNNGSITGGPGGYDGIHLAGNAYVGNSGRIAGSAGYYGSGPGGLGIYLASGLMVNFGFIAGGMGGNSNGYFDGGVGGTGIELEGKGRITNYGTIQGGRGGYGKNGYSGGLAGNGVELEGGGSLVNGGGGLISGEAAVYAGSESRVSNAGSIDGATGVVLLSNCTLVNTGQIGGFYAGVSADYGAKIENIGYVEGGNGRGGIELFGSGSQINNSGNVTGGYGGLQYGRNGGAGILIGDGVSGTNSGFVRGGDGRYANPSAGYFAAQGGYGIDLVGASKFTNAGLVIGGVGGAGAAVHGENSPAIGGAGVQLAQYPTGTAGAPTFVNTGVIRGGRGGVGPQGSGAVGGAGVLLDGGTLFARAGVIAGGFGGNGAARGDAVQFGTLAGTLAVSAGATFEGDIVANPHVNDTLELAAGRSGGTLTGFGVHITGFNTIREDSGATWRLDGTLDGNRQLEIGTKATLQFYGMATVPHIVFDAGGNATLLLGNRAQVGSTFAGFGTGDKIELAGIAATSLSYTAGTLTLLDAGGHVVDTLHFSGSYTQADFALQSFAQGTAVVYAGSAAETLSGHFGGTAFGGFLLHHGIAVA